VGESAPKIAAVAGRRFVKKSAIAAGTSMPRRAEERSLTSRWPGPEAEDGDRQRQQRGARRPRAEDGDAGP
jgi:hypothetical protein